MDIPTLWAALIASIAAGLLSGCVSTSQRAGTDSRAFLDGAAPAFADAGAESASSTLYYQAHSARLVALAAVSDTIGGSFHDWIRSSDSRDDGRLGVLSYNMKRRERRSRLEDIADHLSSELADLPDFILCQEVMFRSDGHGGRTSSAADLARLLGYEVRGCSRQGDREGLAILSRFPFDHFEARQLQARSLPLVGWPRVSLMGEFMLPRVGRVRVVNVHLSHQSFEHGIRRKQLAETLEWVAQRDRAVAADVTIFGGDLNTRPNWAELALVANAQSIFNLPLMNYNSDEPTKGGSGRWRHRIDYIFIAAPGQDVGFLGERLLWKQGLRDRDGGRFWASDHLLVHHEYAIMPRNQFAGVTDVVE